jgi:hypothetical protein
VKNVVVTVIVGFITGLVISGILFDVIKYVGKSFNRIYIAWDISKAEKCYSGERFSESINLYNKVIPKIDPSNKLLLAKTKNNLALSMIKKSKEDLDNNICSQEEFAIQIKSISQILDEAYNLAIETKNQKLISELEQNRKNITNS